MKSTTWLALFSLLFACSTPKQNIQTEKRPSVLTAKTPKAGRAPATDASVSGDYVTTVALARQQTIAHFNHAMQKAIRHANAKRYPEARAAVDYALAAINTRRSHLSQTEYETMHQRALQLQLALGPKRR